MKDRVKLVQQEVITQQTLLKGIPSRILDVEKTIRNLEKFVNVNSVSEKREQRELADRLGHPYKQLFKQLDSVFQAPIYPENFKLRVNPDGPSIVSEFVYDSANVVNVIFSYEKKWNCILAEVPEYLLNLFEDGDNGEVLPSELLPSTTASAAGTTDQPSFIKSLKRPFRWAQELGGILPETRTPLTIVEKIIDRLSKA